MKIIDWDRKGNVLRLYLGEDNLEDWWGDDWDDRPYECNAGEVYDEFVAGIVDVAFPYNFGLFVPADDCDNSDFCKDDFKKGVPFMVIVPNADWFSNYAREVNKDGNIPLRFGDDTCKLPYIGTIINWEYADGKNRK